MNKNFKLYLKCVLTNQNHTYLKNLHNDAKNINILLPTNTLYYLSLHFRFSSLFYSTQLTDIFSYELPSNFYWLTKKSLSSILVYNFHTLSTQNRFFVFVKIGSFFSKKNKLVKLNNAVSSITELFFAANWLEREVSELHSISFIGKKDLRNLMLQYGDSTAPFQKSFPTIGLREMFYNPIKDTIIQNPISIQL